MSDFFSADDLIYAYTREQAIADGVLIDANTGELDEITRQFFKIPVAMTAAVFALVRRAVENKRHFNDTKGVWHDVTWMCFRAQRAPARRNGNSDTMYFDVIISGTGQPPTVTLKAVIGAIGPQNPAPCLTLMLPEED